MTKIPDEKVIAGLSCGDVLERLSDYLDQELAPAEQARVEEHLRGCEGCARFGGQFRTTIRALKEHLARDEKVPPRVKQRLFDALDRE